MKGLLEGLLRADPTDRLTAPEALAMAYRLHVPRIISVTDSGQLPACWFGQVPARQVARAVLLTVGGSCRLYVSANFERLVLGCIEAGFYE